MSGAFRTRNVRSAAIAGDVLPTREKTAMKRSMRYLTILSATLLALAVACGGSSTPTSDQTTPSQTASPSPSATTPTVRSANVYFLRGEKVASVHRDVTVTGAAIATAAMRALLDGPTATERTAGLTTTIPSATELNAVTISGGTADVDLTAAYGSGGGTLSMSARLMQVVFTLTQFPTVRQVTFRLDGKPITALGGEGIMVDKPQTRAQYESFLPPIFIDSPAMGETVTSPLTVRGVANVFEGQFMIEVTDSSGTVLVKQPAHASMGSYSAFAETLSWDTPATGAGRVTGYDRSPKDGARIDDYVVPVTFG